MRFAKNLIEMRVCAEDAVKGERYLCPACNQDMILRKGKVMSPHFAHHPHQSCIDTWTYDESNWQRAQQKRYPAEKQEILVRYNEELHRADVVVGNNVILFQQEPISTKFFAEKTNYFLEAGKDVFWVFDVSKDYQSKALRVNPRDQNSVFWDNPIPCLKKFDPKANKRTFVFLAINEKRTLKVEWAAPEAGFKRFIVDSSYYPDLMTEQGCEDAKLNQYARFDAFKQRNMPWHKKASSTNGAPDQRWHKCEKTEKWHLDACKTCEHNLICEYRSANSKTGTPGGLYFYCCYPRELNEVVADKNGKKKARVPSIWLK